VEVEGVEGWEETAGRMVWIGLQGDGRMVGIGLQGLPEGGGNNKGMGREEWEREEKEREEKGREERDRRGR
jgi:hypothetical protein